MDLVDDIRKYIAYLLYRSERLVVKIQYKRRVYNFPFHVFDPSDEVEQKIAERFNLDGFTEFISYGSKYEYRRSKYACEYILTVKRAWSGYWGNLIPT